MSHGLFGRARIVEDTGSAVELTFVESRVSAVNLNATLSGQTLTLGSPGRSVKKSPKNI